MTEGQPSKPADRALLEKKIAELEERNRVITLLGRMSDALQRDCDPSSAYGQIVDFGEQLFPGEAGALVLVESGTTGLGVMASWRNPTTAARFAIHECRALRGRTVHSSTDHERDAATTCGHIPRGGSARNICMPVLNDRDVLGVVCFEWRDAAEPDGDPFQTVLARAFANQVGLALTNLRLKALLRNQAMRDPLTGLHNRRFLEEAFRRELLRAARNRSSVGVLMLDIDHFKEFNDTHGHVAGDALLRAFAQQLRREIREEDTACRYGGEEFIVIIPDAGLDLARSRAEQIRNAVREVSIDMGGSSCGYLTISGGVAAMPEHGASADALLRAADAALYLAKARGRDRIEIADRDALPVTTLPRREAAPT